MENKEKKLEDLKSRALQLMLSADKDTDFSYWIKLREQIAEEYRRISAKYTTGDIVYYLDHLDICQCNVISVGIDHGGNARYIISETTGRTINGNYGIPESELFPSREDLKQFLLTLATYEK